MAAADSWTEDEWCEWVDRLREARIAGELSEDVIVAIEMIPDWEWTTPEFVGRSHARWLAAQQLAFRVGTLTASQIAQLDAAIPGWKDADLR